MASANDVSLSEEYWNSEEDLLDCRDLWKWRQVLKKEVEEDIQRQVLLRLKVNSVDKEDSENTNYFHQNRTTKKKDTAPKPKNVKRNTPPEDFHSEECSTNAVEQDISPIGEILQEPPKKGNEISNKNIKSASQFINLSGLLQYVNSKYGAPRAQLKNLSEAGHYQTAIIDTSGIGNGPCIRHPVESNIFLSTPKHITMPYKVKNEEGTVIHKVKRKEETFAANGLNRASASLLPSGQLVYTTGEEETVRGDLEFESRFESGNLKQAIQITPQEYVLWLAPDLYSDRHTQWFYFSVKGMVANKPYTFHIVNFTKPDSLYNYGMQPLLYSKKMADMGHSGWIRHGYDISYHKSADVKGNFYTLRWTMEFPHCDDLCYFAHCFPYPYSQLLTYIAKLEECPKRSRHVSRETLCHTLAGNCCPLLTITGEEVEKRTQMGVVITARVHPGETNSSWVMQGLIDFLTSECNHAKVLRSHYIFKLVPMLNPDGVIVGNYRTSLAGVDLNRVYKSPRASLFPTIYHVKGLMKKIQQERELLLYIDLHGHSRKHNVFMYGCHTPNCNHFELLQERIIPFLLAKQAPQVFDYKSCKFNVQRCKETTGRVVTWRMGVPNSFTMESTFCGSTLTKAKCQFSEEDLTDIGQNLAEAIYYYHWYNENESYRHKIQSRLAEQMMANLTPSKVNTKVKLPQLITKKEEGETHSYHKSKVLENFIQTDISLLEQESSTSGSDSDNDDFMWKTKKVCKKTRHSKAKSHFDVTKYTRATQQPSKEQTLKSVKSFSALPRLSPYKEEVVSKCNIPSGWKFVSKYHNRSNGGIPIFSEERLKERKEKLLLSQSQLESKSLIRSETKLLNHVKSSNKMPGKQNEPRWPQYLEPMGNKDTQRLTSEISHILAEGKIKHLKLSSQLTKYIHDTWRS